MLPSLPLFYRIFLFKSSSNASANSLQPFVHPASIVQTSSFFGMRNYFHLKQLQYSALLSQQKMRYVMHIFLLNRKFQKFGGFVYTHTIRYLKFESSTQATQLHLYTHIHVRRRTHSYLLHHRSEHYIYRVIGTVSRSRKR